MISMLASGSWNDGAGWPTCSMAPAIALQLESILAHFDGAQPPARARSRGLHAPGLATRAGARSRRLSRVRRPARAARDPRARGLAGRGFPPRAAHARTLERLARAHSRRAI